MRCLKVAIVALALGCMTVAGDTLKSTPLRAWEQTQSNAGAYSIHIPKYEGVDQLLLLSSRWVILVTTDLDRVFEKINELSEGTFFKAIETWNSCDKEKKPDWGAYKARAHLRDTHFAEAREFVGERKLDDTNYYTITSDDVRYKNGLKPLRVTRTIVGLGGRTAPAAEKVLRGLGGVYYAHYSYLEMPQPMENGKEYTVTIGDGRKVTFIYDEARTVSRSIKVNQAGYIPMTSGNYAYLGAYLGELGAHDFSFAKTFNVVNEANGEIVLTGNLNLRDKASRCDVPPNKDQNPEDRPLMTGEDVYEMDLSGLKGSGTYFISIQGVGRSWPFRFGEDALGEAYYTSARGFYHQRCGIALEEPYTKWARIKCHTDPVYECEYFPFCAGAHFKAPKGYNVFDVIGGSISTRFDDGKIRHRDDPELASLKRTENVSGGWHDAADWDRNIHHYAGVFDMLYAYQIAPKKFVDGQLNIPESGNGIPDILDEAEFGIRVWKKSMTPEGGVSGMVETWTHPGIDDPKIQYAFAKRTRWSTLLFAASAAQYAHLVKPFSAKSSAEYADAAKKAYAYGSNPANSLGRIEIPARKNRGSGAAYMLTWEEKDTMIQPFLALASARMAILTGDDSYLKNIEEMMKDVSSPYVSPNSYRDFSAWFFFDLATSLHGRIPAEMEEKWRKHYCDKADELAELNDKMPYRMSWPRYQDYWMAWGSSSMCNYSRALFIANAIAPNEKYVRAATQNLDFMLGANAMGMSWTTGIGYVYPIDIQHANSESDGILDPVPGITIYGLTGGSYQLLRNQAWRAPKNADKKEFVDFINPENQKRPLWRRWSCHPHENVPQCEFTVHETMAGMLFTTAMMLPDGWKPSESIKKAGPKPDEMLFGYYYMP